MVTLLVPASVKYRRPPPGVVTGRLFAVTDILRLSDELRDDILPNLGVRLEDHEGEARGGAGGGVERGAGGVERGAGVGGEVGRGVGRGEGEEGKGRGWEEGGGGKRSGKEWGGDEGGGQEGGGVEGGGVFTIY